MFTSALKEFVEFLEEGIGLEPPMNESASQRSTSPIPKPPPYQNQPLSTVNFKFWCHRSEPKSKISEEEEIEASLKELKRKMGQSNNQSRSI